VRHFHDSGAGYKYPDLLTYLLIPQMFMISTVIQCFTNAITLYLQSNNFFVTFCYLSVSCAWWDWPSTWLTNHRPSVLLRCWLGHLTRKIVSEIIYIVSSGRLNPTIRAWVNTTLVMSATRRGP